MYFLAFTVFWEFGKGNDFPKIILKEFEVFSKTLLGVKHQNHIISEAHTRAHLEVTQQKAVDGRHRQPELQGVGHC